MDKFLRLKIKNETDLRDRPFVYDDRSAGRAGCAEYYGYVFRHAEYLGG